MAEDETTQPGTLGRMKVQLEKLEANLELCATEVKRFRERIMVLEEKVHDIEGEVNGYGRSNNR